MQVEEPVKSWHAALVVSVLATVVGLWSGASHLGETGSSQTFGRYRDVPSSLTALSGLGGGWWAFGYCYRAVHVYGLDVWTWQGHYCLHGGRSTYVALTDASAAALARQLGMPGAPAPPFEYRYPPAWIVAGVFLGLGVPAAVVRRRMLDRAEPALSLRQ